MWIRRAECARRFILLSQLKKALRFGAEGYDNFFIILFARYSLISLCLGIG